MKASYIVTLLFLSLNVLCVYFLLPEFSFYGYQHKKLNSLFHSNDADLRIVGLTKTYTAKIKSIQEINDEFTRSYNEAHDLKVLRNRLNSYFNNGEDYEVRTIDNGKYISYEITTLENITSDFDLLTTNKLDFVVNTVKSISSDPSNPNQEGEQVLTPLKLTRNDFGVAEVRNLGGSTVAEQQYQVRLPLAINLPLDKLTLIEENKFQQISVSFGEDILTSQFSFPQRGDTGTSFGSVTYLNVSSQLDEDRARRLATLLNSETLLNSYVFQSFNLKDNTYTNLLLIGYLIFSGLVSYVVLLLRNKSNIRLNYILLNLFGFLGYISLFKFFDIPIDAVAIILGSFIYFFTLFRNSLIEMALFIGSIFSVYIFGIFGNFEISFAFFGISALYILFSLIIRLNKYEKDNK